MINQICSPNVSDNDFEYFCQAVEIQLLTMTTLLVQELPKVTRIRHGMAKAGSGSRAALVCVQLESRQTTTWSKEKEALQTQSFREWSKIVSGRICIISKIIN